MTNNEVWYLRFGEIPKDEQSSIHYRSYYCGKEKGVSVYHCTFINHKPHIILPMPCSEGAVDTLTGFLFYSSKKPIYLVTGDEIGTGHDGEPLIQNIKIIKDITSEFWNDMDSIDENALHEELLSLAAKYEYEEE